MEVNDWGQLNKPKEGKTRVMNIISINFNMFHWKQTFKEVAFKF